MPPRPRPKIVLYVEKRCSTAPALVGTVGKLAVPNGAINVIPGRCDLSIDIRAGDDAARDAAAADVLARDRRDRRAPQRRHRGQSHAADARGALRAGPAGQLAARHASAPGSAIRRLPSGAGHER